MSKEERKEYWADIQNQPDDHKDVQDWLDLLAGKEVPDANPYNKEYDYSVTNVAGLKTDFFSINLNQSYAKDGQYQIWFNGKIEPTRNWSMTYSARYDWNEKRLIDYSFGLSRNMHCWEAVFNFTQLGEIWRYDFKIRIKEIPDVEIGKGLLGYFLE